MTFLTITNKWRQAWTFLLAIVILPEAHLAVANVNLPTVSITSGGDVVEGTDAVVVETHQQLRGRWCGAASLWHGA